MVSPPGDICVDSVWRPCLKNHPHFFERFSFRHPDLSCRNLSPVAAAESPQSQSREGNLVTVKARDSDREVLAREARFGVRRLDAAFGKTLRLAFPLRISQRHRSGRAAGVTHRG